MGVELFNSNSNLLMAWLFTLVFTLVVAGVAGLFPERLTRFRTSAFALMIFPPLVVALFYALRGFGTLERSLVHWVLPRDSAEALHLGLVFDPVSFAATVFTGAATMAICFRNRPSIRMSAALALSWLGLSLAATSQTLWMAVLGIGIQVLSRTFPLAEGGSLPEREDARWIASTKRAWIGLGTVLCGGAGLASQGIRSDFFSEATWAALEATPSVLVAGGLLIFGLLILATPALASNALYQPAGESGEESIFVSELSLAWIAVLILFRLFGNLHEPEWLLAIGIGATVIAAGSLGALTFQSAKSNAIHLWLATAPVATLMILPFVPARESYLYLVGSLLAVSGLWVALDHRRSKAEIAAAAVFFLGATGFVGWSTSAGLASFFGKFQADPALHAPVFIVLILYWAFGWRLVLRGGDRETATKAGAKWIVLGLFFVLGFGPLLSGRFGGGSFPGETDWIEGAKAWPWIRAGSTDAVDSDWIGFAITQGAIALSLLLGVFAWRTAELFPFAKKYPRGTRAAAGLFGLVWIQDGGFGFLKRMGSFLVDRVSTPIWERGIPFLVFGVFRGLRRAGALTESVADPLTGNSYGRVFTPAAKLVQWLHGGNVRLYAWFALVWILIFSIYLTR
jgi:hypothetical protein